MRKKLTIFTTIFLVHHFTLNKCGLSYVWLLQREDGREEKWLKSTVETILLNQFIVKWRNESERSTNCDYYRHFKLNSTPEKVPYTVIKAIRHY